MSTPRTFFSNLLLFLKGVAMGAANKVPGVSGGAVAFVLGFYEEMIYSFQKANIKAIKLLISGRFKSFFVYTNLSFLMLLMGGSIFSFFSVSIALDYLLRNYELNVWSTFFGMIIGSVIYINRRFSSWNGSTLTLMFFGVIVGSLLSFLPPAKENPNLWFVFFCGAIGVSGMTLPGLSGSFILMLLGNYVLLLVDSVNVLFDTILAFISGDFYILKNEYNLKYLKISITFFLGSTFGLVSISHFLAYVLKRWNSQVTAIIIGFITGSLTIVWPWKEKVYIEKNGQTVLDKLGHPILEKYTYYIPDLTLANTWSTLLFLFLGLFLVVGVGFLKNKK